MKKTGPHDLTRQLQDVKKKNQVPRKIEKALIESEKKYRTLTENITVGIFRSTPGPAGRFMEVNPAFVEMLGYQDKKELMALDVAQIYQDPADRLRFSEKMSREGFVKHEELILRKKDGSPVVISETAIAVKDTDGNVVYFDGIVEDITGRKRAGEELDRQKSYLEQLFNSATEAIVLHDTDDRIVDVNDEFTRMFGYSREEVIGRPINEVVASPDFQEEAARISEQVLRGQRISIESKRKRKDGTLISVSIIGAPIFHNGKQVGDYAIYRDITEHQKAEEEIHIQKTYLEKLFNSAPEAIVLHDNDDRVVDINEEFTRMFGYKREEAIGQRINDLVAPDEFRDEAEGLSSKVTHGNRVEKDSKRRRKDGTLIDVWILGAPITDAGKQMGVYAIYRDITERKRAEEARYRLSEEMRLARQIQMNLLPKSDPVVPGYDITGTNHPASGVGGDYYDFIYLEDGRLAIGIGDVSGKGLAASMVMANLQATIRSLTNFDPDPKACLERANKLLCRSTDSRTFVSFFYGILDPKENTLVYANAGQDLPVLFSVEHASIPLANRGIALGLKEDTCYRTETVKIKPGDRLLIYTDGITEAMNADMEEFGEEELLRTVSQTPPAVSAGELVEIILTKVRDHMGYAPQNDDMTVVVLKMKE